MASVTDLTADIVMVTLDVNSSFTWAPGQYVDVQAGGATRAFSMANLPGDGTVQLIIRRYPGGRVSGLFGTEIVPGSEGVTQMGARLRRHG